MKKLFLIFFVVAMAACSEKKAVSDDAAVGLAGEVTPTDAPAGVTPVDAPDAATATGE